MQRENLKAARRLLAWRVLSCFAVTAITFSAANLPLAAVAQNPRPYVGVIEQRAYRAFRDQDLEAFFRLTRYRPASTRSEQLESVVGDRGTPIRIEARPGQVVQFLNKNKRLTAIYMGRESFAAPIQGEYDFFVYRHSDAYVDRLIYNTLPPRLTRPYMRRELSEVFKRQDKLKRQFLENLDKVYLWSEVDPRKQVRWAAGRKSGGSARVYQSANWIRSAKYGALQPLTAGVFLAAYRLQVNVGVHHFVVCIPNEPQRFPRAITIGFDRGTNAKGFTLSGYPQAIKGRERLRFVLNEANDRARLRAYCGDKRVSDQDIKLTRILWHQDVSTDDMILQLIKAAHRYNQQESKKPVQYDQFALPLLGYNSNSWAQSLVKHVIGDDYTIADAHPVPEEIGASTFIPGQYFIRE